ncbi:MAG: hypothetical protein ABJB02_11015, partial [Dokdonella sp.]
MQFIARFALLLLVAAAMQPHTASAAVINQEAKLTASLNAGANSGSAVSISGDTAVVVAAGDNGGTGSVYVFLRSGGVWAPQQTLTASDGVASDLFGASVSIAGDN